ncbi:hypothetical protein [Flavobacterium granuli]|uniref:GLPGLI family protein n=1 Tax=Flavobacterium granuli TaxID=280093 RepID=A0ABU1S152_9FLAO|nr:hypothetical protein [Flavobacterium granuli]MDR6843874.1 hypothetical protein [Flavobacterium granuli]
MRKLIIISALALSFQIQAQIYYPPPTKFTQTQIDMMSDSYLNGLRKAYPDYIIQRSSYYKDKSKHYTRRPAKTVNWQQMSEVEMYRKITEENSKKASTKKATTKKTQTKTINKTYKSKTNPTKEKQDSIASSKAHERWLKEQYEEEKIERPTWYWELTPSDKKKFDAGDFDNMDYFKKHDNE